MRDLDLADRAEVPVRALSGGQRKRASIAVELLTRPRLFFLDEPTSGLDPSTAADVMRLLRRLSQRGVTVVLTTHEPAGIDRCDRVVFLARDGHLAFTGSPTEARRYFGVRISTRCTSGWPARTPRDLGGAIRGQPWRAAPGSSARRRSPPVRQPLRRQAHGRGPAMVATDAAQCRRSHPQPADAGDPARLAGAGHGDDGDAVQARRVRSAVRADVGPAQIVFWIAFDGFFFGLTYGLLQIVGEMAVFRRERLAGLSVGAYVASKVTALLPVLAVVSAVLLGVLRALGRLPAVGWDVYAFLFVTIVIEATSALALGLLASAAVSNAAQAALALPMLCFPQVLFGGAIVPVDQMATPGRLMSLVLSNRHAFEALGRDLDLDRYTTTLPAMSAYRDTFHGGTGASLIALASFAVVLTLATVWVLDRRSAPGASRR